MSDKPEKKKDEEEAPPKPNWLQRIGQFVRRVASNIARRGEAVNRRLFQRYPPGARPKGPGA